MIEGMTILRLICVLCPEYCHKNMTILRLMYDVLNIAIKWLI